LKFSTSGVNGFDNSGKVSTERDAIDREVNSAARNAVTALLRVAVE
jgi:hypothetical protein